MAVGSEYGNESWKIRNKPTAVSFSGLTVFLVCLTLTLTAQMLYTGHTQNTGQIHLRSFEICRRKEFP